MACLFFKKNRSQWKLKNIIRNVFLDASSLLVFSGTTEKVKIMTRTLFCKRHPYYFLYSWSKLTCLSELKAISKFKLLYYMHSNFVCLTFRLSHFCLEMIASTTPGFSYNKGSFYVVINCFQESKEPHAFRLVEAIFFGKSLFSYTSHRLKIN